MNESILTSIKKLLGIDEEYEHFDVDVIIHINNALNTLRQLGVGPTKGFSISDSGSVWSELVDDQRLAGPVKDYVYLTVKLIFDPPLGSATLQAYKEARSEAEFRIMVTVDEINSEKEGIQNE